MNKKILLLSIIFCLTANAQQGVFMVGSDGQGGSREIQVTDVGLKVDASSSISGGSITTIQGASGSSSQEWYVKDIVGRSTLSTISGNLDTALSTRSSDATLSSFLTANHSDLVTIQAKQDSSNSSLSSIDTKLSSEATAARQDAGNSSLSSIDTKLSSQATAANQSTANSSLSSLDTKTPTVGQKTMAGSSPVVIASDQSVIPASQSGTWNIANVTGTVSLPAGAATATNQTTANSSLSSIDTKLSSQATAANQATANSSLSTIATNTTGAATAANQVTANSSLSSINTAITGAYDSSKLALKTARVSELITFKPTISTTPAYSAGDHFGSAMQLSNVVRVAGGSGTIKTVYVVDQHKLSPEFRLLFFNADPGLSGTDNNAFNIPDNFLDSRFLGHIVVSTTDYVSSSFSSAATKANTAFSFKAADGTRDIWVAVMIGTTLVTGYNTTQDVKFGLVIEQD